MNTERKILKEYRVKHVGWDIPTKIILDHTGHIWMDDAHGSKGFDGKRDCGHYTAWLQDYENEPEYSDVIDHIHETFGLKPRMPGWMITALDNGWSPPEHWKREDYWNNA